MNDEDSDQESKYNLANVDNNEVWNKRFYNFRTFGSGFCFTYNPPAKTSVDFQSRLFMLFGNRKVPGNWTAYFIGFVVYIHEKGQFWPKL